MLDQYHYKNKDFDYETVSRYIKELFQIWSKNHRRYVHLLRQSFVTTKFTNSGFIDGTKGEDINGWLDKEFS